MNLDPDFSGHVSHDEKVSACMAGFNTECALATKNQVSRSTMGKSEWTAKLTSTGTPH